MKNFWCEVYPDVIDQNIKKIRLLTNKKLMAVIKGNAYGLGIEKTSEFLDSRVDSFAVTYFDEAHRIKSGKDILIMTPDYKIEDLKGIKENFILTVDDIDKVRKLAGTGRQFRVHIFVNTGMNRFGIYPDSLSRFIEDTNKFSKNIGIEGVYTHLHNTDNKKYTSNQITLFESCVKKHIKHPMNIHLLNSKGFINHNIQCGFDSMIRVGGILFGYDGLDKGFKRVYQYKAAPINVYKVEKGKNIGYGNLYKTNKNTTVGVLGFGYIDKFYCPETIFDSKILGLMGRVFYRHQYKRSIKCNGKPVKILGSVNMNYTLVDMGNLPENTIFDVEISPMAADSSVPKEYI